MVEACGENPCPTWTKWAEWSDCPKTCLGGGRRRRVRQWVDPVPGGGGKGMQGAQGEGGGGKESKEGA